MYREYLYVWRNCIANSAILFTIALFSAGILTCRDIFLKKSVGVVPYLPFLAACLNCSFWACYGFLKGDHSILFINTFGLLLQFCYLVVYYWYTENKKSLIRDVIVTAVIVGAVMIYIFLIVTIRLRLTHLGLIANFFTICFFGSPLSTMATVVRSRNTESMSLPFSVLSSLVSSFWALYGVAISDVYVQFPNFIGFILSVIQLSLFCVYPSKGRVLTIQSPA